jgi:hypothetical protein
MTRIWKSLSREETSLNRQAKRHLQLTTGAPPYSQADRSVHRETTHPRHGRRKKLAAKERSNRRPLGEQPGGFPLQGRCVRAGPEESTAAHRDDASMVQCVRTLGQVHVHQVSQSTAPQKLLRFGNCRSALDDNRNLMDGSLARRWARLSRVVPVRPPGLLPWVCHEVFSFHPLSRFPPASLD